MSNSYLNWLRNKQIEFIFDMGNHHHTVFLAGTGRSGTTWVEDIINYNNSYRIMFEPFHSKELASLKEWNYRQYLRPDNQDTKFVGPATKILNGKIRHPWIDQFNRKTFTKKRLIKDIRANLILKWIKARFPRIPIVLLLRHPCAVANSKMKLGWDTHLDDFLIQHELMHDLLGPFESEIRNANDIFDKHIFLWCIENYIPLRQFSKGEILVTFYENLCVNPTKESETILSFVKEESSLKVLDSFTKPSALSRNDSAIISGSDLVSSWRDNVSTNQINRAIEILSIFGMHAIYNENNMPLASGNDALNAI